MLVATGLPCKGCTSSDAMAEYADGYYCFSCGTQFTKTEEEKKKTVVKKSVVAFSIEDVEKYDFKEIPKTVKPYFYKYSFTDELLREYKIGYISDFWLWNNSKQKECYYGDRLIYPYYENNKLVYVEAKSLTSAPKYITIGKKNRLFKSHAVEEHNKAVIITEDMLSAIRVGEEFPAVCLNGTSLNDNKCLELVKLSDKFILWLDGDKPGQKAAKKIRKKLSLFGQTFNIVTSKDPKAYSPTDIRKRIDGIKL